VIRTSSARLALAAYVALTLVFTLPLAFHLTDRLPHDAGDPLFVTCGLWWNAHAIPLTSRWWNPPIFYPMRGALALSDHLLGLAPLTSIVQWAGGSAVLAYNVAFLSSFALAGFCTFLLARELSGRADVAFVAGLLFAFNPFRWSMISHLQLLQAFWMPLALFAAHRFLADGRMRWAALFGASWLFESLSNGYMLVFFSLVAVAWLLWFVPWRRQPARGATLAGVLALGGVLLAPILIGYGRIQAHEGLTRSVDEIQFYGADAAGVLTPSSITTVYPNWHPWPTSEENLFPGVVLLVMTAILVWDAIRHRPARDRWTAVTLGFVAIGFVFVAIAATVAVLGPWSLRAGPLRIGASQGYKPLTVAFIAMTIAGLSSGRMRTAVRNRSTLAFYALGAAACYVLSWGLRPRVFGAQWLYFGPYSLLMHLPGLRGLRVPARVWLPGVLLLTVAAALMLASLLPLDRRRRQVAIGALIVAALIDGASVPIALAPLPPVTRMDGLPSDAAVLELPLGDLTQDLAAMYRGTFHQRPAVNGYSGYIPRHYEVLRRALADGDFDAIAELATTAPIAVLDARHEAGRLQEWARTHPYVRITGAISNDDPAAYVVDRQPLQQLAEPSALQPVAVTASVSGETAASAADGRLNTRWHTHRAQRVGDTVTLDAGRLATIEGVALAIGEFPTDYPRDLEVSLSGDGASWEQVWRGRTAPLALRGALERPAESRTRIMFAPRSGRLVRLRIAATDPTYYWSIAEAWIYANAPAVR
jgi:F5/8 type C domain